MEKSTAPSIAASTLPLQALTASGSGLEPTAVRRDLGLIKSCGVDHVDITDTWLPVSQLSERDVVVLRDAIEELGLAACGVSIVRRSIIDAVDGAANLEHTRRAIDLAVALGAAVVSIGFHEPLSERARAIPFWSIEAPLGPRTDPVPIVRELAREAAAHKVSIALELYEGGPLGSGRLAVDMLGAIGEPNVGVNLDVGNLYRSPLSTTESWLECVETCLPVTNFWHVKNYQRIYQHPEGRLVGSIATSLWEGDIDYRRCMDAARAAGYSGPVIVEHYGGDGIAVQRAGVAYLEELVGAW